MGNGIYYGLDSLETYICDGTILTDSSGRSGKVVTEIGDTDYHSSLPSWSKTSEIYFKRDDEGDHAIEQMRVFKNRRVSLDFDWNHSHGEFKKGIVHVHEWYKNKNGKWQRSGKPRYMTLSEIKKYGELLKLANPFIKFYPDS